MTQNPINHRSSSEDSLKNRTSNAADLAVTKGFGFGVPNRNHQTNPTKDGLKHPWIVTAAAPDPETGREKTVEALEDEDPKGGPGRRSKGVSKTLSFLGSSRWCHQGPEVGEIHFC